MFYDEDLDNTWEDQDRTGTALEVQRQIDLAGTHIHGLMFKDPTQQNVSATFEQLQRVSKAIADTTTEQVETCIAPTMPSTACVFKTLLTLAFEKGYENEPLNLINTCNLIDASLLELFGCMDSLTGALRDDTTDIAVEQDIQVD